jgi:hypothetical protein
MLSSALIQTIVLRIEPSALNVETTAKLGSDRSLCTSESLRLAMPVNLLRCYREGPMATAPSEPLSQRLAAIREQLKLLADYL